MEFFGHPERDLTYIHIAGTKGKTSTCYYLYQMLLESGRDAGLFVSPHIFSERERIQRNGSYISYDELAFYKEKVSQAREVLLHPLGFFEEYVLLAFLFFRDHPVEYVVLEVGIGGLLDTTNVITPHISVITRIKKDHQEILGKRLTSIIKQKLGIIKPHRPFIIGKQNVFVTVYIFLTTLFKRSRQVPLLKMRTRVIREREISVSIGRIHYLLQGPLYMRENFLLAMSVLSYMNIPWEGRIFTHRVPGRMQPIEGYPYAFLDGAHNQIAVRVLANTLVRQFPGRRWKIIFCVRQDKDIAPMIRQLKKVATLFLLCPWDEEIKPDFDPKIIVQLLKKQKQPTLLTRKEMLNTLLEIDDNILVTGSFYHLSLIYKELRGRFL